MGEEDKKIDEINLILNNPLTLKLSNFQICIWNLKLSDLYYL